jgi:thioredoxin-like negative regulator of GroEL
MNKNNQHSGFSSIALIGIVAAVVAVIIMFGLFVKPKTTDNSKEAVSETVQEEIVTNNSVSTDPVLTETENSNETVTVGSYEVYSPEKIARAATGDVVLFFHASWCPSCRALNNDIEKNRGAIPGELTILKTDYDTETELKKKYGVTSQHTLVQVDTDGNLIKKWSGGSKLTNLVSQIQ